MGETVGLDENTGTVYIVIYIIAGFFILYLIWMIIQNHRDNRRYREDFNVGDIYEKIAQEIGTYSNNDNQYYSQQNENNNSDTDSGTLQILTQDAINQAIANGDLNYKINKR